MNKYLPLLACLISIFSCTLMDRDTVLENAGEFRIEKDGEVLLAEDQVERYDFSSHILYLKDGFSLPVDLEEFGGARVMLGERELYPLSFYRSYNSFSPSGAYVHDLLSGFSDFALQIAFSGDEDVRENPELLQSLQRSGKYRAGLRVEVNGWDIVGDEVQVLLSLHNQDVETYLHLDPEKMSMGGFHYFTNGLTFLHPHEGQWVNLFPSDNINSLSDSWNREWLSPINGNSTKTFLLTYPKPEVDLTEVHQFSFSFPGLSTGLSDRSELIQEEGRIWLGSSNWVSTQP